MDFPLHALRDYALIADGERGAVIGPRGDIVWMCAPRWDSDAVFSALIGGEGIYAVTPAAEFVWGGYYEDGSLVWRSRWITRSGITECQESLAYPAAPDRLVVLRRVVAREGPADVTVRLDPRAGFGQHGLRSVSQDDQAYWTGRVGELHLRWSGDVAAAKVRRAGRHSRLELLLTVPPGEHRDLVLELSAAPLREEPPEAGRLWHVTRAQWAQVAPALAETLAPAGRPAVAGAAARHDQPRGRDGRGRDHQPARAGRAGPQLRLPVRVDPGPGLRGPGGRRGRSLADPR